MPCDKNSHATFELGAAVAQEFCSLEEVTDIARALWMRKKRASACLKRWCSGFGPNATNPTSFKQTCAGFLSGRQRDGLMVPDDDRESPEAGEVALMARTGLWQKI